jgi:hypothetical protein
LLQVVITVFADRILSPQYYAKLVFDDRKFINPKCPNQRLVARLGFIKNKVISSQSTLKLALGNDFGLHLEAAELDVLFSHWSRDENGDVAAVTYSQLLQLFDFGRSYEAWSKASQAREEGGSVGSMVAEPAPVLHSAPTGLREKMQDHAIRAHQTVITKAKSDKERWAIRAREGDERAQRSAFLWKVAQRGTTLALFVH